MTSSPKSESDTRTPADVQPLDPNSPAGKAAAEALSEVLAEIQVAIWRRRAAAQQTA